MSGLKEANFPMKMSYLFPIMKCIRRSKQFSVLSLKYIHKVQPKGVKHLIT